MMRLSNRLAIAWLSFAPLFAFALAESARAEPTSQARSTDTVQDQVDQQMSMSRRFRDVFRNVARTHGMRDAEVQKIIFPLSADVLTPSAAVLDAKTPMQAARAMVENSRNTSAIGLYQYGINTPFGADENPAEIFAAKGPVTFIVIPPLLSELLPTPIFDDILNRPSSFRDKYQAQLGTIEDKVFNWLKMKEVNIDLGAIVRLGSIDDASGNPLVQLIVFQSPTGSLETIGPIALSRAAFARRVEKLLNLLPDAAVQNPFLLGYSRGGAIALDMIANAAKAPAGTSAIMDKIRGIVTLGGVVYGSELAEVSPSFRIGDLADMAKRASESPLLSMHQAYDVVRQMILQSLDPLGLYKRLKLLEDYVNIASEELKTESRLRWWQKNTLPANFPVYSINGAMPVRSMIPWYLPDSPFFNLDDPLMLLLGPSAARLYQLTQVFLNDGQVIEAKGRPWPSVLRTFNPKQENLQIHSLGVVTTHHFGLGGSGSVPGFDFQINKFPRSLMVEALGAYVLETL